MTKSNIDSKKLYYSIREIADDLGVNISLIRYWEKEFPNVRPKKNSKGVRFFKEKDLEQLRLIYHLVKERGMTLKGAKEHIKESKGSDDANFQIVSRLKEVRKDLVSLIDALD